MKKIKLINIQLKSMGFIKYMFILIFVGILLLTGFLFPYLRDIIHNSIGINSSPVRKAIYYMNVETIRDSNGLITNKEERIKNDLKIMDLIKGDENIESISPIINVVTLSIDEENVYTAYLLDEVTFRYVTGIKEDFSDFDFVPAVVLDNVVDKNLKIKDTFEADISDIYFKLLKKESFKIVDYKNSEDTYLPNFSAISNSEDMMFKSLFYKDANAEKIILLLKNKIISDIDIYENLHERDTNQRMIYFKNDTSDKYIDEIKRQIDKENIGYTIKGETLIDNQLEELKINLISDLPVISVYFLLLLVSIYSFFSFYLEKIKVRNVIYNYYGMKRSEYWTYEVISMGFLFILSVLIYKIYEGISNYFLFNNLGQIYSDETTLHYGDIGIIFLFILIIFSIFSLRNIRRQYK